MVLARSLIVLARVLLGVFLLLAFLLPPLALFSPYLLVFITRQLALPLNLSRMAMFLFVPFSFIVLGFLLWWTLESLGQLLKKRLS